MAEDSISTLSISDLVLNDGGGDTLAGSEDPYGTWDDVGVASTEHRNQTPTANADYKELSDDPILGLSSDESLHPVEKTAVVAVSDAVDTVDDDDGDAEDGTPVEMMTVISPTLNFSFMFSRDLTKSAPNVSAPVTKTIYRELLQSKSYEIYHLRDENGTIHTIRCRIEHDQTSVQRTSTQRSINIDCVYTSNNSHNMNRVDLGCYKSIAVSMVYHYLHVYWIWTEKNTPEYFYVNFNISFNDVTAYHINVDAEHYIETVGKIHKPTTRKGKKDGLYIVLEN